MTDNTKRYNRLIKNLNFKNRIRIGFLILFIIMLFVGVYGIIQLIRVNNNTKTLYDHPILVRKTIKDINIELFKKARLINDIVFAQNNKQIDSLALCIQNCDTTIETYFKIVYERFLGNKKDVDTAYQKFLSWNHTINNIFLLKRENKLDSTTIMLNYFNQTYTDKITVNTKAISDFAEKKTDELVNSSYKIEKNTIIIKTLIFLFIFLTGVIITIYLTNSVIRPINKFLNSTKAIFLIQKNNLDKEFKNEEELFDFTLNELKDAYQNIEQQNEEIKMNNEKLVRLNASLEDKVTERTLELKESVDKYRIQSSELQKLNDQYSAINEKLKSQMEEIQFLNENLAVKNEILNELNATKDKFFSIIAHDLINPFNSILGFSDLISKNALNYAPDKVQQFAQNMNYATKQIYTLLENLLEWSRLQAGSIKSNPVKIKPSEIINEALLLYEPTAKLKNLDLQSIINCDDYILADKEMLNTILRNLISNALKFTIPNGFVKIYTQNLDKNVLFIISDTGLGIESEHIANLFKIDCKLSKAGTLGETGTGLGLILCKEFVEKNNGKFWVESELGKGSDFKFTIPLYID